MPSESPRSPNIHELESLRIARIERPRRRFLTLIVVFAALITVAVAGYLTYQHTLGRSLEVQTATAELIQAEQPRPLISGSGYVSPETSTLPSVPKFSARSSKNPLRKGV